MSRTLVALCAGAGSCYGRAVSASDSAGFAHDVLFHGSDEQLLAAAEPFLRAGLAADETVLLACDERHTALLMDALGGDDRIGILPRRDVYQRVPAALAAYQTLMEQQLAAGAHRVRVLGELDFDGRLVDRSEWMRYEAVVNRSLAPYPMWGVCMYDTLRLPATVLAAAELTHPNILTPTHRGPNARYLDPIEFLRQSAEVGPDPLEASRPALVADEDTDLRDLRSDLHSALASSALPVEVVEGFVFAINEVVTNAMRHGRPPMRLRLWSSPSRAVCTVTDDGPGFDDPFAGYLLASREYTSRGGLGLWLARQLCDQVSIAWTAEGFTVRLALG